MAETVKYMTVEVHIKAFVEGEDGAVLVDDWSYNRRFLEGTGANQIGFHVLDESRALDTASEDLQLDSLGAGSFTSASAKNVKLMAIHNVSGGASDDLILGGSAGGNEWLGWFKAAGDKAVLQPDGLLLLVAPSEGLAITAGDDLGVEAEGDQTYSFRVAGDNA